MAHWRSFWRRLMALVALLSATLLHPHAAAARDGEQAEEALWRRAEDAGTAEAYEAYLRQYPLGRHTREAFRRVIDTAVDEQAAPTAPVREAPVIAADREPSTPPPEVAAVDDALWSWAQVQGTTDAFRAYLDAYPLGRHTREAFRQSILTADAEPSDPIDDLLGGIAPAVGGSFETAQLAYE